MWNTKRIAAFFAAVRRSRINLGLALFIGVFLAGLAPALQANAGLSSCDGDPIAILSNGVRVDMSVHLNISARNVQQVVYTLHAPAGTSVVNLIYTSGSLYNKESFAFVADQSGNQYLVDTIAYTSINAKVTATTMVSSENTASGIATVSSTIAGVIYGSDTKSGLNNQDIYTNVSW